MGKTVNTDTVVEWVQSWLTKDKYYHPYSKQTTIPISELYDILEQMPSAETHDKRTETHGVCLDTISRQAAIEAVIKRDANCGIDSAEVLKGLPSAQPDNRLTKIAELVGGSIDHFDLDDAMDLLYQIKEVLK